MKTKKGLLLFLALLFPACIFLFLKFFGKNEFDVAPLYTEAQPDLATECGVSVSLPYHVPPDILSPFAASGDKLILIRFGEPSPTSETQIKRLINEHGKEIKLQSLLLSDSVVHLKKCVFFLADQYDLVLVDHDGLIRGQYISEDREEMDRLLTELSILLKKY